MAATIIWKRMP